MTPAQITLYTAAVKADIIANADLSTQPLTTDGAFEIARLYNLPSSPPLLLWDKVASVATSLGV